jgi:predicted NAD/FAD-binding protein
VALGLGLFEPGAVVRVGGRFHRVADPLRSPQLLARTVAAPIGTPADKARLARLVLDVRAHSVHDLLRRPDMSTAERLARAGFSERMVESFWRPLFAAETDVYRTGFKLMREYWDLA